MDDRTFWVMLDTTNGLIWPHTLRVAKYDALREHCGNTPPPDYREEFARKLGAVPVQVRLVPVEEEKPVPDEQPVPARHPEPMPEHEIRALAADLYARRGCADRTQGELKILACVCDADARIFAGIYDELARERAEKGAVEESAAALGEPMRPDNSGSIPLAGNPVKWSSEAKASYHDPRNPRN